MSSSGSATLWSHAFAAGDLSVLRSLLRRRAAEQGLAGDPLEDLLIAAHELAINAVRHGGGSGVVSLCRDGDELSCAVADRGPGFAGGVPERLTPPPPDRPGGRGLWVARQLTDGLRIRQTPAGVTVTITVSVAAGPGQADRRPPAEPLVDPGG